MTESSRPPNQPAGLDWDSANAAPLLIAAGEALMQSLEYRKTLDALARLVVADFALADWCGVYLRGEDGRFERAWVRHRDPEKEVLASTYLARPPASNIMVELGPEIAGGKALLQARVDDGFLESVAQDQDHLDHLRALGVRSLLIVPLRAHGQVTGALTLARCSAETPPFDLRDRATAEDLGRRGGLAVDHARAMGHLEEHRRLIEGNLGTIAHDLRNPINVIINVAQLLADIAPKEEATRYLPMLKRGQERAVRLIDDILITGRVAAGKEVVLNPARIEVSVLLEEIRAAYDRDFQNAGIVFDVTVLGDSTAVLADRDRAIQAIGNIVGNAVKFTPKGGRVEVRTETIGELMRFIIQDTGPGIPDAEQSRIFQPYGRAGGTGQPGTGLGLASARGIAEAHGGAVWVTSRLGEGSTFSLTLPIAPA